MQTFLRAFQSASVRERTHPSMAQEPKKTEQKTAAKSRARRRPRHLPKRKERLFGRGGGLESRGPGAPLFGQESSGHFREREGGGEGG